MITPTLTPAYDRDYKSKKEVLQAIEQNKDFVLNDMSSRWNGLNCSPSDFKGKTVKYRYGKLQKVFTHKL